MIIFCVSQKMTPEEFVRRRDQLRLLLLGAKCYYVITLELWPTPERVDITVTEGADINDTGNFVITDTAAADGAIMDTVSGTINDTGETVGIGDLVWGKVPVA